MSRIRLCTTRFLVIAMTAALLGPATGQAALPLGAGQAGWEQCSQGMYGGIITALALSPAYASDGTLFAGTSEAGVFRSTDAGRNWSGPVPGTRAL